ncbi:hypothetical protein BASA83_000995 [Batrachochytrium salamandrivorans]|nr:hypothetical protein BASA83_000995 [Batrachochytrium salamandrivorans]
MSRSKSVVDNHIEEMKPNACSTLDAWSNIKNEPIVNYMLISDSSLFFLESVSTGEQSHNAKWIAQDIKRMIAFLAGKVCGGKQKESQQKIHDIITDGKFVEHLDKAIMILNPVNTAIVVFQK